MSYAIIRDVHKKLKLNLKSSHNKNCHRRKGYENIPFFSDNFCK